MPLNAIAERATERKAQSTRDVIRNKNSSLFSFYAAANECNRQGIYFR